MYCLNCSTSKPQQRKKSFGSLGLFKTLKVQDMFHYFTLLSALVFLMFTIDASMARAYVCIYLVVPSFKENVPCYDLRLMPELLWANDLAPAQPIHWALLE